MSPTEEIIVAGDCVFHLIRQKLFSNPMTELPVNLTKPVDDMTKWKIKLKQDNAIIDVRLTEYVKTTIFGRWPSPQKKEHS